MDFNNVFALNEAENPVGTTTQAPATAPAQPAAPVAENTVSDVPPSLQVQIPNPNVQTSRESLDVANANLKKLITAFENDPRIKQMEQRYDGPTPTTAKGTFGHSKQKFLKSVSKVGKVVIICVAIAVLALVGGSVGAIIASINKKDKVTPNLAGLGNNTTGLNPVVSGAAQPTETVAQTTDPAKETPQQIKAEQDLSTWQARVKAGRASDADMEEAYKAYKAGTYTPGVKTMAYFKQAHPENFVGANAASTGTVAPASNIPPAATTTATAVIQNNPPSPQEQTLSAQDAPVAQSSPNPWDVDRGYQMYKRDNAKAYSGYAAQSNATGRDPDEQLYSVYQAAIKSGTGRTGVAGLRAASQKAGYQDSSVYGTDNSALRHMQASNLEAYNANQVDNLINSNPALKTYVDVCKQFNPKLQGLEDYQIINRSNSWMFDQVSNRDGSTNWVIKPQFKDVYNASEEPLKQARELLKNKTVQ